MREVPALYGLLAEFDSDEALYAAAQNAYAQGYRRLEGYSPYPIPGLAEALGFHRTGVPTLVLLGGLLGCIGGFFLQYYLMAVDYPLNVGGRPPNSWPMYIPVTFELTILCAVLTAVISMLALSELPQLDHPVFNVDRFSLVSRDRFFLFIAATDRRFVYQTARSFLLAQGASEVTDVETQLPDQIP